jgi:hypothetical protein
LGPRASFINYLVENLEVPRALAGWKYCHLFPRRTPAQSGKQSGEGKTGFASIQSVSDAVASSYQKGGIPFYVLGTICSF